MKFGAILALLPATAVLGLQIPFLGNHHASDSLVDGLKSTAEKVGSGLKDTFESVKHSFSRKPTKDVTTWNTYKLRQLPRYSIRFRETVKLCDPNVKQIVGYLDVDEDKHFFFWFFESRTDPAKDPLVLWLNGGPGCSSMTGLLMELGPCRVNPGGNGTTYNHHSWNNHANLIFLDQPVNAGFSYSKGKQVSSSDEAAQDVYSFLQLFLSKYGKYKDLDFHVTGESYAGHYIPAIGKVISENNAVIDPDTKDQVKINLKSLAIGNGLTDPLNQYEYYPVMACESSYGPILEPEVCEQMKSKVGTCKNLVQGCYKWESKFTCVPGAIYCNNALIGPVQQAGINVYDVRKKCEPGNSLCYSIIKDIETWANLPHIQKELGVDREFSGCNMDVNRKFLMNGDWNKPYVDDLPPLLEEGVRILIYAGDADFICNWYGNNAWTKKLEWYGQDGFNEAKDVAWKSKLSGKPLGEYRTFENFAFLRVFEAGHMVPYDQPEHSLEFFNEWIGAGKGKDNKFKGF